MFQLIGVFLVVIEIIGGRRLSVMGSFLKKLPNSIFTRLASYNSLRLRIIMACTSLAIVVCGKLFIYVYDLPQERVANLAEVAKRTLPFAVGSFIALIFLLSTLSVFFTSKNSITAFKIFGVVLAATGCVLQGVAG